MLGMLFAVEVPPASALGGARPNLADMAGRLRCARRSDKDGDWRSDHRARYFLVARQIGFTDFQPGERAKYPPSPQRLGHAAIPVPDARPLYLSAHASHVALPVADGRAAAQRPQTRMQRSSNSSQPQMAYRRTWSSGQSRHDDRGRPHDETQPRDLRGQRPLISAR